MELTVIESVQKLTWNFEEVKAKLNDDIQKYVGLVVNDENLASMEKTQKEIAGLRTRIQKFRLAVKKDLQKPYNAFELQIKELAALVETAELPIKEQLQKYEDKRKEDKENKCREIIAEVSNELGLADAYRDQIVIDSNWINRGTSFKSIKEEIQVKVCWFLDIQTKDIAEEANRVEKVNMAQMMCEFLSKDLVTPVTFEEVENKIESLNITELRTYIENQVAARKEREEKAKQLAEKQLLERQEKQRLEEIAQAERAETARQQALEREEQQRIAELARLEKEEQERIERERKQAEFERNQSLVSENSSQLEHIEKLAKINEVPPLKTESTGKLYNAQFVTYNVTEGEIENIRYILENMQITFKHAVKDAK